VLTAGVFGTAVQAAGVPLPVIAPGVTVGGVAVGGLTSEMARTKITERYGTPITLYHEDKSWRVSPGQLGADTAVQDAVDAALDARADTRLDIAVGIDRAQIRRYVARLDRRYRVEPVSSELIGLRNLAPAFTEAKEGRRIDRPVLVKQLVRALRSSFRSVRLPLPFVAVEPERTPEDFGSIIVIRRASNQLSLYFGPALAQTYGVATGAQKYPTPLGEWEIVTMQRDPWWIPPDSDWAEDAKPIPPGPGNPLGTRWMGLNATAVGIHGTPDAASIGYSASHGCIRMRIPDAEALFNQVDVGTPVYVVDA
jgi:L,D-transpeptidase catalytic domain/Putative peptidoglycan binding domain